MNTFRGISLISLVGTVVRKILKNRLSSRQKRRPHNGRARWLSEEERVQGPITASGATGTNRDGEESCGNASSIY